MSASQPLPRSVIAFMREHVDHVVKLRFLLALSAAPDRVITVRTVARLLDVPRSQVRDMANELVDDGLLRIRGDELELSPSSVAEHLALSDLAHCYATQRAAVLEVLAALRGDT